jgi:hypothetical protein
MDPNACLQRIKDAIEAGDRDEVVDARNELRLWVENGGFEPNDPDWRAWMIGRPA